MESRTLLTGCLVVALLVAAAILVLSPAPEPVPTPAGLPSPTGPASIASPALPAGPASAVPSLRSDTPGTLTITSSPPGAAVWIDTDPGPSATTPATLTLSPITHPVLLRYPGYRDYVTSVKVRPGVKGTLDVVMEPGS